MTITDRIGTTNGTDDAGCHGVVQSERVADGDGPFPRLQLIGVTEGCYRQVLCHHLDHGDIGEGVTSEHLAVEAAPVRKRDLHPVSATDNMFIGEDQSIGPGDEA